MNEPPRTALMVRCVNPSCSFPHQPIPILWPTPEGIASDPQAMPTEVLALRIVCRECMHWHVYPQPAFRVFLGIDHSQGQGPRPCTWIVTGRCGKGGCGVHTRWYLRDDTDGLSTNNVCEFVGNAEPAQRYLDCGHPLWEATMEAIRLY